MPGQRKVLSEKQAQDQARLLGVYKTWSFSKRRKQDVVIKHRHGAPFLKRLRKTCFPPSTPRQSLQPVAGSSTIAQDTSEGSSSAHDLALKQQDLTVPDSEVLAPTSDLPDEIFSPNAGASALIIDEKNSVDREEVHQQVEETHCQEEGGLDALLEPEVVGPCPDDQHEVKETKVESPAITHLEEGSGPRNVTLRRRKSTPVRSPKYARDISQCTTGEQALNVHGEGQVGGSSGTAGDELDLQAKSSEEEQFMPFCGDQDQFELYGMQEKADDNVEGKDKETGNGESLDGTHGRPDAEDVTNPLKDEPITRFSPLAESTMDCSGIDLTGEMNTTTSDFPVAPGHSVEREEHFQTLVDMPRRKTARKQFVGISRQLSSSLSSSLTRSRKRTSSHQSLEKRRISSVGQIRKGMQERMGESDNEEALLKEKVLNKTSPSLKVLCTSLGSPEVLKGFGWGSEGHSGEYGSFSAERMSRRQRLDESARKVADTMKQKIKHRLSFSSSPSESPKRKDKAIDRQGTTAKSDASGDVGSCSTEVENIDGGVTVHCKEAGAHDAGRAVDADLKSPGRKFSHVIAELRSAKKFEQQKKRGQHLTPTGSSNSLSGGLQGTGSDIIPITNEPLLEGGDSRNRMENLIESKSHTFSPPILQQSQNISKQSSLVDQNLQDTSHDTGEVETLSGKIGSSHMEMATASKNLQRDVGEESVVAFVSKELSEKTESLENTTDNPDEKDGTRVRDETYARETAHVAEITNGEDKVKVARIVTEKVENNTAEETMQASVGKMEQPRGSPAATVEMSGTKVEEAQPDSQIPELTPRQRKERRQTIWEGSLRKTPAKFKPFQVPTAKSPKKRKAMREEDTQTSKRPALTPGQERTPRDYRKVAIPSGVVTPSAATLPTADGSAQKMPKVEFSLGQLVWGHMKGYPWWPGKVVHHHAMKRHDPPPQGQLVIQWFGDMKFSMMKHDQVSSFEKFKEHINGTFLKRRELYRKAMFHALKVAASQVSKTFSAGVTSYPKRDSTAEEKKRFQECLDEMVLWAEQGFQPAVKLEPLLEDTEIPGPPSRPPTPVMPKAKKDTPRKSMQEWADTRADKIKLLKNGEITLEEFCLACGSTSSLSEEHPLFVGGLCEVCRVEYLETAYMIANDGYQCYCCICAEGKELILCENKGCYRSFCTTCIEFIIGADEAKSVMSQDPWVCYMCQREEVFGYLQIRQDWPHRLHDFFSRDHDVDYAPLRSWPPKPLEDRKPIRVLSLFDGIGTGMYVLRELGFKVDVYIASEIDPNAIKVSSVRQKGMITQVGDVREITSKELAEWGPFDLLIGGSPCNDLSIVNPARKGIYGGSGLLFFEYARILHLLHKNSDPDRPLFWFFENVVFMDHRTKMTINRFLECNPVLVDAKDLSPAHRARYFWGNLPGINRPSAALLDSPLKLQDCLEQHCNRKAKFSKVRTITTKGNSLKQKSECQLPVEMDGKEDSLWCTELERLFGFPNHYTDVSNLNRNERQRLLGKCWSVPVIQHLLSPLKDYYQCE